MKRLFVLPCLFLIGCASGTAGRREEAPSAPAQQVPEDISLFCARQCSVTDDGVEMVARKCLQECIEDLARKQSALVRQRGGRG